MGDAVPADDVDGGDAAKDVATDLRPPRPNEILGGYAGLSASQRMVILVLGWAVACANLMAAWYMADHVLTGLPIGQPEMLLVDSIAGKAAAADRAMMTAYVLNELVLTKFGIGKYQLMIVVFAAAFALISVGFSLFVIGADGAFRIAGTQPGGTKLVISGTAPGILCFLLAAGLVYGGITHRLKADLPGNPFDAGTSVAAPAPTAARTDCFYEKDGICLYKTEQDAKNALAAKK
jgi:hypothetical protein